MVGVFLKPSCSPHGGQDTEGGGMGMSPVTWLLSLDSISPGFHSSQQHSSWGPSLYTWPLGDTYPDHGSYPPRFQIKLKLTDSKGRGVSRTPRWGKGVNALDVELKLVCS